MILVTGGTGFLGGHLVAQLLERGDSVRMLCRNQPVEAPFSIGKVDCVIGDVTRPETLGPAMQNVRAVYHVAGLVDFNPRGMNELLKVNEQGTRNILSAAKKAQVEKIVHVSSVSTIGGTRDPDQPLTEKDFGTGTGVNVPYPQSKLRAEKVALEFSNTGLPIVICNPTFFAGPGDKNLSSARTIMSFVRRQTWIGLTQGGFGYTDVRDVAAGLILAMEKGNPGERYILGGHNMLLREYHALLSRLTGIRAPRIRLHPTVAMGVAAIGEIFYDTLKIKRFVGRGDVRLGRQYWLYDYSKAQKELGLICRTPDDSLRDALRWLDQQGYKIPMTF